MKTPNPWPAVVLVLGVVAAVVVLAVARIDLGELAQLVPVLVVPLLGVLVGQVQHVKAQTNGNVSRLMAQIDKLTAVNARQSELLAQTVPVVPPAGNAPELSAQGVDGVPAAD